MFERGAGLARGDMQKLPHVEARALDLFERCSELAPAERDRWLDRLQQSDRAMHAQVLRLLQADAQPDAFLHSPQKLLSSCAGTASPDAVDPRIGCLLGPWRITALIGEGGMGRVYLASRADGQYAQDVALKCVSMNADPVVLAEVIRNERDMLAMLEHPNIATLLDGGIDADGCPWFVMQRVRGEAIDAYCDHRRLDLRARVGLFLQLCDGLRHAHGKGALHSDIKPANVMVDDGGRPVLLDFGLASLAARTQSQAQRRLAVTYGYTAPEVPVDGYSIASDVYALGVLLRALLCGVAPMPAHQSIGIGPESLCLPSQAALSAAAGAASARGLADVPALAHALRGDLDSIVAACTAHEPSRRPATVAHVQDDLRAWLTARPISARRRESGYRLHLFLRRHRVAALVACLALLGSAIGGVVGMQLHDRAEQSAQESQSMRRLFDRSFDSLTTGSLGQSPLIPVAMLRQSEADLRAGAASGQIDGKTALAMLLALARSYTTLGDYPHAAMLLQEAQAQGEMHDENRPALAAARAHLLNLQSRHAQAQTAVQEGSKHLDALAGEDRELTRLLLDVELARAQWGMAKIEDGRATLRRALQRAERLAGRDPRPLASLLILEGEWLRLFSRYESAVAAFERAATLTREAAPLIADEADMERIQVLPLLGHTVPAVELAEALLERRRRVLGERHPETGKAWVISAQSHFGSSEAGTALSRVTRGEEILRTTLGADHPETVRATMLIGIIHTYEGRFDQAVSIGRNAVAVMERVYGPDHQKTMAAIGQLGAMLAVTVANSPESPVWDEVIELFARRVDTGMRQRMPMLSERMVLIKARMHAGKLDENALGELEQIVDALTAARGRNNDATHKARFTLIQAYMTLGNDAAASTTLRATLHDLASAPVTMATETARINCHDKLGDLALKNELRDQARAHWQQALAISRRMEKPPLVGKRIQEKLDSNDG